MKEEDYAEIFDRPDVKKALAEKAAYGVNMLWLAQRGHCYWCGRMCMKPSKRLRREYGQKSLPADFFTLDHIQSRWQGGGEGASNVIGACNPCNQMRNNAEHKRETGKHIADNQPEELRLKRFLPIAARTIPFEKGLSRRESRKSNLRIGSRYGTVLMLHEKQHCSDSRG
jgi:hypothetical protein